MAREFSGFSMGAEKKYDSGFRTDTLRRLPMDSQNGVFDYRVSEWGV